MLQLSRDELLKCYRSMRTIREFEDRVHEEFASGKIPGFVHLYAVGCSSDDLARLHAIGDNEMLQLAIGMAGFFGQPLGLVVGHLEFVAGAF